MMQGDTMTNIRHVSCRIGMSKDTSKMEWFGTVMVGCMNGTLYSTGHGMVEFGKGWFWNGGGGNGGLVCGIGGGCC